ncbi:MAG: carbamoyltransferase HypF [Rhodocyclaceae bacterium]|uniref:Carbamoyltransferase HypF n=1 Tax=Candidatus Desulfobacillus denitrificans TaxID=2608985 RepID=A0A809R823_9PROT|nr:carbamoyltransferase HypF [Candidatus Desulfobacillus denitrificans]GIK44442.1 MAG: carbamoyltransferase HypF [Betaproteobacteria bacterium]GJQ54686.1 MAG: carbamoyltransferase HypF [Rhodocyclaceae bacterium]
MTVAARAAATVCRRIRVRGQVQGVGFRPFVYRLAQELDLAGWVRNDGEGVDIEAQGAADAVEALIARLETDAPPLASVTSVEASESPLSGARGFEIKVSLHGTAITSVTPDSATCSDCLAELFDPANRRWRHAFANCTHCGPRYTVTRRLPYDRPNTSMAEFALCPACRSEYEDPADRRFHAQPNACPECGPRLALRDGEGGPLAVDDSIAETLARLQRGEIVAIKGLGGYHLACDATNAAAVARLRQRKNREEKPFAVMFANAASVAPYADLDEAERALLESRERPVVLLRKRAGCDEQLAGVAPGLGELGAMLPCTPIQYLLFHEAAGRPAGTEWIAVPQRLTLVMTSANPGGEPIVREDDEALARLQDIADAWLMHDRAIVTRVDDSVLRAGQFIRRARGFTPQAIKLAKAGPSVLATGGFLKNTICLTRGDEAYLSQHIGDLDNAPTCRALEETAQRMMALLEIAPERVAHDLHPDFHGTRFAADFARGRGLKTVAVQHHHAHIAAVAAEHRATGPLLGLALDGVGMGADQGIWGGELLAVDGERFDRLGHLRELALPGGDKAAREPWRMAAAALFALGRGGEIKTRFPQQRAAGAIAMMLGGNAHTPPTSSCGRLFDAAAGLAGVCEVAAYEGQAAMLYESQSAQHGETEPLRDGFILHDDGRLDLLPLLARLADERDAGFAAALFHATLDEALAAWVQRAGEERGLRRVALGGGCFLNRILSAGLRRRLEAKGFEVLEARLVPPNDGGLSLGQAWVALNS